MLIVRRCILVSHELLSCEFSQTGLKKNEIRLNLVKKDYTPFRMHFGFLKILDFLSLTLWRDGGILYQLYYMYDIAFHSINRLIIIFSRMIYTT